MVASRGEPRLGHVRTGRPRRPIAVRGWWWAGPRPAPTRRAGSRRLAERERPGAARSAGSVVRRLLPASARHARPRPGCAGAAGLPPAAGRGRPEAGALRALPGAGGQVQPGGLPAAGRGHRRGRVTRGEPGVEAAALSPRPPSPHREWWTQQRRTSVEGTPLGRKRRCPSMNSGGCPRPALSSPPARPWCWTCPTLMADAQEVLCGHQFSGVGLTLAPHWPLTSSCVPAPTLHAPDTVGTLALEVGLASNPRFRVPPWPPYPAAGHSEDGEVSGQHQLIQPTCLLRVFLSATFVLAWHQVGPQDIPVGWTLVARACPLLADGADRPRSPRGGPR